MKYTVYVKATIDKVVEVEASNKEAAFDLGEKKVRKMLRGTPNVTSVKAYCHYTIEEVDLED